MNLQFYEDVDVTMYEEDTTTRSRLNFVGNWFHKRRQQIVNEWMGKNYEKGMVVLDMACGTCTWNSNGLDVIGVDVNEKMLRYAVERGRLKGYFKEDITDTKLPHSIADIIILGDVLEHLHAYEKALQEAKRLLKPEGKLFVSVPYDTPMGLWWWLFNPYCLVKGWLGSKHHKVFGGHVQHFSPKWIKEAIEKDGFDVQYQFNNKRFTIYTIAKKNKGEGE